MHLGRLKRRKAEHYYVVTTVLSDECDSWGYPIPVLKYRRLKEPPKVAEVDIAEHAPDVLTVSEGDRQIVTGYEVPGTTDAAPLIGGLMLRDVVERDKDS